MNPVSTMPPEETTLLEKSYRQAEIILEYGSGSSTKIAAAMPGKYVISVESDLDWARNLRKEISTENYASPATVYHVDIGPTGPWGRPLNESKWRHYHKYPNSVWDEPFFHHPDVVLIDGRFRTACLMAVILHATKPTRVLFDDYFNRPKYRRVETIIKPVNRAGRMAEFNVTPNLASPENFSQIISHFFEITVHDGKPHSYMT